MTRFTAHRPLVAALLPVAPRLPAAPRWPGTAPRPLVAALLLVAAFLLAGCDLVLYDADLTEGARRSQELTEVATVTISGWDVEGNDGTVAPVAWYPATLGADSGYLISDPSTSNELVVAWVDRGSVAYTATVPLFGASSPDRWDAWIVPIDTSLQASYQAANPTFPPRAPALLIARFREAGGSGGTSLEVVSVIRDQAGLGMITNDLTVSLEGVLQTDFGLTAQPSLYSLQVAGFGPGILVGGAVTDTAGVVIQVLARDNDSGQDRFAGIVAEGLAVANWAEFVDTTGITATGTGGSFFVPTRTDGTAPTLIRHATLVENGPGSIISFRDDDFAGAPWRSFGVPPAGGTVTEFSTGFGLSSVTVEGRIRTARSGSIGELSFDDLPDPTPAFGDWGSLWFAGTYATQPGQSGNPGAFSSHAAADVHTQVGLVRGFGGDLTVEATTYRR